MQAPHAQTQARMRSHFRIYIFVAMSRERAFTHLLRGLRRELFNPARHIERFLFAVANKVVAGEWGGRRKREKNDECEK